jgi:hypothetical protein
MEKKEDLRGAIIRQNLNDLNGYMQENIPEGLLGDYDEMMNLYENTRGDLKVDIHFYTNKKKQEVFRLIGSKITKNGLYRKSDNRFYDINLLFDYRLTNLLLFIFLRDTMHVVKYDFSCVTPNYRLDKAAFGKFYKEVLVYFI